MRVCSRRNSELNWSCVRPFPRRNEVVPKRRTASCMTGTASKRRRVLVSEWWWCLQASKSIPRSCLIFIGVHLTRLPSSAIWSPVWLPLPVTIFGPSSQFTGFLRGLLALHVTYEKSFHLLSTTLSSNLVTFLGFTYTIYGIYSQIFFQMYLAFNPTG